MKTKKQNKKDNHKKKKNIENFSPSEVVIIATICIILGCLIGSIITLKTSNKSTSDEVEDFTVAYNTIIKDYYKKLDKSKLIGAAINGMFEYIGDPHTTYMDKKETEEFNQTMSGKYKGIGATIAEQDDYIVVVGTFKDSPADKAGIKEQDLIISINDKSTKGKTADEAVKMIKSKDKAKIKVKRDDEEKEFNIVLSEVTLPSVESDIIEKNNQKVGLISISTFASNTYQQFNNQLNELEGKGINSLIIDLRNNPGGYLEQASSIASLFMDKTKVIYQIKNNQNQSAHYSTGLKNKTYKVVILADKSTVSAAEILTAAFKESYGSDVVGTTTYGKGTVQNTQRLSNGSSIKLTIESWLSPNGNVINGKGIKPTIEVELSDEYYDNPCNETDNQLQKALEVITKK